MKFRVFIEKKVLKQLEKFDEKTRDNLLNKFRELKHGFSPKLDIKKLKGFKKYHRIRIGGYPILFELQKPSTIILYAILHRKSVYKH